MATLTATFPEIVNDCCFVKFKQLLRTFKGEGEPFTTTAIFNFCLTDNFPRVTPCLSPKLT